MSLNKTAFLVFTGVAGAVAALFVGVQRRIDRAKALEGRVEVQDWESAPLKGTVPAANPPSAKEVATRVTGVPVS
jgi:hypothetical protein